MQPLGFTPVSDLLEVPDPFDDLLGLLEDGGLYTVRVQPIELGALGNEQDTVRCKQRKRLALIALKHSSRESNRVQNQRLQPPTCAEAYAKYAARTSSVRRLKILVTPSRWAALARDMFGSWHISPTSARKAGIWLCGIRCRSCCGLAVSACGHTCTCLSCQDSSGHREQAGQGGGASRARACAPGPASAATSSPRAILPRTTSKLTAPSRFPGAALLQAIGC